MVAEMAIALTLTANELVRPGCSLLPVTLPDDDATVPGTVQEACAVLGRPLPNARVFPAGMQRADIGIDGPPPLELPCCRMVHVSYSLKGRNVGRMTVFRQDAMAPDTARAVNATLGGVPAIIQQTHASVEADDVSYLWARDGLLIGLHIWLADGISREAADDFAASIR
jgi:hypothetical protein